ncbi:unnamed protein product [Coregonus sp. 'balchen']|nr:unnamed protein product [Coregonus sp. 'balchen']
MLHQFLKEEEDARLASLREKEKGTMIAREMKNIQDQISSLTENLIALEQKPPPKKGAAITHKLKTPRQATEPSAHWQIHSWS